MEYIEISARTLDDAITKACIELGISSDNLEYKVIQESSNGFLGIGSKPAIIKARKMMADASETEAPVQEEIKVEEVVTKQPEVKETKVEEIKETVEIKEEKIEEPVVEKHVEKERIVKPRSEEEVAAMKKTAEVFLADIFKAMGLEVTMEMEYDQQDGSLNVDFIGPEMGILIGKRGQTLDSLQYLTSLVINKGQDDYTRVKLDTENYRNRRKDTLENLARNIAYKVKKSRKSVALEPMNPYERRIIHSALQNNKFVTTTSEGEEPFRHVVVLLKK